MASSEAIERASKADERASANEREAAQLRKETARLTGIAEGEKLARVKIQEQMAPRRLTAGQIRKIADKLRRFSGQRLNFFATAGDSEIMGMGDDVLKALTGPQSANWMVTLSTGQYSSLVASGIVVEVSFEIDATSAQAAAALAVALRGERLAVVGPRPPPKSVVMSGNLHDDPQAKTRLVIAKKP